MHALVGVWHEWKKVEWAVLLSAGMVFLLTHSIPATALDVLLTAGAMLVGLHGLESGHTYMAQLKVQR